MIRTLSVVGFHKTGKTKVVETIVRKLTEHGYLVGTLKHITKSGFTIDQPGKDSWLHAKSGAMQVVLLAPKEIAKIEKRSAGLQEILESLYGLDFVIVEGFKDFRGLAKVVVAKSKSEADKLMDAFTIACVGVEGMKIPCFDFESLEGITEIVERKAYPLLLGLDCRQCGMSSCEEYAAAVVSGDKLWDDCPVSRCSLTVTVDGKRISLSPFAKKIFTSTIKGMVSSLKGVNGEQINIRVMGHD